jgi:Xaa-Pro aminopeptidase
LCDQVIIGIETYQARLTAVRAKFDSWKVDGVHIGSAANRRWLSGFTGSSGQLLITREKALLATDGRYWERAVQEAPAFTLFKHQRTAEDNENFIRAAEVNRIGVESHHTTIADLRQLQKIKRINWFSLPETVEGLRAVKTAVEIDAIKAAAAITDYAMSQVNQIAKPGMTEKQLAWELEKIMREAGADGMAFPVIVASGPNSALPHHHTGKRPLQSGDTIIIDMGAELNGYCSDLTRTFYLGSQPSPQFQRIYDLVHLAQTNALHNLRPGMTSKEGDALAREVVEDAGHKEHFGHGLGHGVGLEIHEDPGLTWRHEETLPAGSVITIEPGVYLVGWGGVRIEDLIYLTEDGPLLLSQCPKDPVIN